ncbi:NAD(P)H-binding protein [Streptomyces sp. NPDC049954]|uniref:NAD(P)H-binding protein n=1 Tax=Streptomyces sp. NPDC049954 TaxID=3155779 RepID=UPI00342D636A
MTFLVTGARGRVGRAVARGLLDAGRSVRVASSGPPGTLPGLATATVPFNQRDPAVLAAALTGVSGVFLYARPEGVETFVRAARACGVEHVVLLSSLAVLDQGAQDSAIARSHRAVEEALTASGIALTLVRPGGFASNTLQWSEAIRTTRRVDLAHPDAYTEPVHERDMAEVAVRALLDPAHRGAVPHLTGPESLTQARQVELIAEAIGSPVTVRQVSPEEYRERLAAHLPGPVADAVLRGQAARVGHPGPTYDGVREVLGRPATSFARWALDHAGDFR